MIDIFAISGLVNAFVSIGFGLSVAYKNSQERQARIFILMTIALFFWGVSYWQWLSSSGHWTSLLWIRLVAVSSLFIPVLFFHWVVIFLKNEYPHRILIGICYLYCIGTASQFASPLLIADIAEKMIFSFWPTPGILYSGYFLVCYIGLILYTLYLLLASYLSSKIPSIRGQIVFIALGAIIGFGGGLTNFFLWYDIHILPYGTFLVAFFPFLLGYSVVRHGLFEIKVIATEIFVALLLVVFFMNLLLSASTTEWTVNGAIFTLTIVFGLMLIRSVNKEVAAREEIRVLAKNLSESNWQLARTNEQLKVLDQRKSEFVSLVSHQLRTPITAIKGYASMLLEESYGNLPVSVVSPANKIFLSADRLAKMVTEFLDLSKIEQGTMAYTFGSVDVGAMVSDLIVEFTPVAEKKGLTLELDLPKNDNFIATADDGKIRQIFSNLIDNAIKYTPKGQVLVSAEKNYVSGTVLVKIKDSGIGLSQEDIHNLFGKFTRGSVGSKHNTDGSGLGLYVAKKMVEAQKGKIWVDSEGSGKGSTFVVELVAEEQP
jgi:signal transduction histidine kinase